MHAWVTHLSSETAFHFTWHVSTIANHQKLSSALEQIVHDHTNISDHHHSISSYHSFFISVLNSKSLDVEANIFCHNYLKTQFNRWILVKTRLLEKNNNTIFEQLNLNYSNISNMDNTKKKWSKKHYHF